MSRLVSLLSCLIFCQSWCFIFYYFYSAVFMIFTLSFLCVSLPVLLGTVTLKANFMILPFQFSVNFMFFSLVVPSDLVTSVAVSTSVFAFFSVCSILNILLQHHIITTYSPLTVHFPHNSLSAVFSAFFPHTTLSPLAVQCLHHYITYSSITSTSVLYTFTKSQFQKCMKKDHHRMTSLLWLMMPMNKKLLRSRNTGLKCHQILLPN